MEIGEKTRLSWTPTNEPACDEARCRCVQLEEPCKKTKVLDRSLRGYADNRKTEVFSDRRGYLLDGHGFIADCMQSGSGRRVLKGKSKKIC